MYQDTDTVIVAASRTAIGSFNGSFRDVAPYKLGSAVIQSLLGKINMKASDIDEVILGQILTAGKDKIQRGRQQLMPVYHLRRQLAYQSAFVRQD